MLKLARKRGVREGKGRSSRDGVLRHVEDDKSEKLSREKNYMEERVFVSMKYLTVTYITCVLSIMLC